MSLIKRAAIAAASLVAVSMIGGTAIAGADVAPTPTPIAGTLLHVNAMGDVLKVSTRDVALKSVAGDPTVDGASVQVKYGAVNMTYALPRTGWRKVTALGAPRVYQYFGQPTDAITLVTVNMVSGSMLILGHGTALQLPLGATQPTVNVGMTIGATAFCMAFGGQGRFVSGKLLDMHNAPAPADCSGLAAS